MRRRPSKNGPSEEALQSYPVPALEKGLDVLEYLSKAHQPLGLNEVATALGEDPMDYALRGGEDFELCYTALPGALAPVLDEFRGQFGIDLTCVGVMTSERSLRLVHANGSQTPLSPQAFDHFQR